MNKDLLEGLDSKLKEFFEETRKEIIETVSAYLETVENAYDLSEIRWERAKGQKGEYERSEDVENPHFRALHRDLVRHKGKMTRNGYFFWLFGNGITIGRKKRD